MDVSGLIDAVVEVDLGKGGPVSKGRVVGGYLAGMSAMLIIRTADGSLKAYSVQACRVVGGGRP